VFADTNPLDWMNGPGRMTVDFLLTPNSYFAANPSGHLACVLRCDTDNIATVVRGQGIAIGNATGFAQPSDLNPTPLIETWMNGLAPPAPANNFVFNMTETARSLGMQDGVTYRFIIETTKTEDNLRYIRYRQYVQQAGSLNWLLYVDTGDVLDQNEWADLTHSGLAFGHVFGSNLVPGWSLAFSDMTVTWGPSGIAAPDQTVQLSRYGAQLQGDLKFLGNSRTIRPFTTGGPSLAAWTAFQDQTTNQATNVFAKPNGTSQIASFGAVNTSNPDTVYQAVTIGMGGARAVIQTLHRGSTDPELDVNIGAGLTVATFNAVGLKRPAATKAIFQQSAIYADLLNAGGANARLFANAGATFDIETYSTIGQIAAALGGAYNANNIENAVRPLMCLVSVLIAEVKNLRNMI
jgi:hypothetical protein